MITQEEPLAQVSAPQIWDKPTARAQIGDYFHIPFMPVMQVVEKETQVDGRVWLLVKRYSSIESEEWVLEPELPQQAQQSVLEKEQDPAGFAGDSVSVGLQPTIESTTEFEQGRLHGQNDALAKWHPIYKEPATEYATGYLAGYNEVLNPKTQPIDVSAPPETWSVTYDPKWDWYRAYVGFSCIGQGTTHQQAERIAQRYIATNEMIRRQNAAVLAAYASVVAN